MDINLNIEKEDIAVIKKNITGKELPLELDYVVTQVALYKTQSERSSKVKIYNPDCEYKAGDLIYKEYNSKIPIGAKKFVELERGVVLKIDEVRSRHGLEEIKLSYDGTSIFRKYIAYLDRQKIDLLLPHKRKKPCEKSEYVEESLDPRTQNAPLIDRDFNILKKKVISLLQRDNEIAFANDKVLLFENLKTIETSVFDRIRQFLNDNKKSVSTEFLVENFLKIKPETDEFIAYCFSINYKMGSDYKIDFQQTAKGGWGKWNLISVVYHLRKDSIVSITNPIVSTVVINNTEDLKQKRKAIVNDFFDNDKTKCILTQREVTAGVVRVKSRLFDFGNDLELEIIDTKTKKAHILYYYSDVELLIGFKEIFKAAKALQGMSITFSKNNDGKLQFTIKEVKKGTVADEIIYDDTKKIFNTTYKKVASQVFVNKSFFLETDLFTTIYNNPEAYLSIDSFNKLVHKIFLDFGKKEKNYEIHAFRLYHIIDLLYPTPFELVLDVLLGNFEFIQSEKFSNVFYLDSNAILNIEEDETKRVEENKEEINKKTAEVNDEEKKEETERLEAIKVKREERRVKRENEMRLKETLKQENEKKARPTVVPVKKRSFIKKVEPVDFIDPLAIEKKDHRAKVKEPAKKQTTFENEDTKASKGKKRVEATKTDDKIDIEDIKKDIKLEELKAEVLSKKKKSKKKTEEKVAYKDNGVVGGVFASIFDNTSSDNDPKKNK